MMLVMMVITAKMVTTVATCFRKSMPLLLQLQQRSQRWWCWFLTASYTRIYHSVWCTCDITLSQHGVLLVEFAFPGVANHHYTQHSAVWSIMILSFLLLFDPPFWLYFRPLHASRHSKDVSWILTTPLGLYLGLHYCNTWMWSVRVIYDRRGEWTQ